MNGQKWLIRAFKKIKEEITEAQLIILGKGELESKLKTLASNLELDNDNKNKEAGIQTRETP